MASIAVPTPIAAPSPQGAPAMRPLSGGKRGPGEPAISPGFWIAVAVTMLCAVVPAVLWPGDATWSLDEPMLVYNAFEANSAHQLAQHGLFGSFPVPYGPLPTQFYQLLLLFTHDLRVMVAVRAGLSAAVYAGALLWLARTLRLTPWFAAAAVFGPYLWNIQRVLWDCNFLIPVSTLGVAAYASFLRRRSSASLMIALTALTFAPLIHLQALPLFLAFVGHCVWRHRAELRQYRLRLIALGIGVFYLNAGYFCWFVGLMAIHFVDVVFHGHSDPSTHLMTSLSGPFLAGRVVAAADYIVTLGHLRGPIPLNRIALMASEIILPLSWIGIVLCALGEARRWLFRRHPTSPEPPATTAAVRRTVYRLALACVGLQLLFVAMLHIPPHVHYGFGTLPIYLLFAWLAVDILRRVWLGLLVVALWGLSVGYLTCMSTWQIHHDGYQRGTGTPTLSNQMEVAQALRHYDNGRVWTDASIYPQALSTLRALTGIDPAARASPGPLLVRYVPDPQNRTDRIELVQLHSEADLPPGAHIVELVPTTIWFRKPPAPKAVVH